MPHGFGSHQNAGGVDHRRPWIPKMDFPLFDGSDVRIWIDKCSAYFHLYSGFQWIGLLTGFKITSTQVGITLWDTL
jgi:hypothetical protein